MIKFVPKLPLLTRGSHMFERQLPYQREQFNYPIREQSFIYVQVTDWKSIIIVWNDIQND